MSRLTVAAVSAALQAAEPAPRQAKNSSILLASFGLAKEITPGTLAPLKPVPFQMTESSEWPQPRRWQYPVIWNLPVIRSGPG